MPVDLAPYADKTMEEIIASLVGPDEEEADFIEDGSAPISETRQTSFPKRSRWRH
jgi:hypothetical protein